MGIAISTGAAIAQEIADITVSSEDLMALVTLRQLSCALMARIHRNYRFIIGFNCSLIGLGLIGILPPTTSALLHNMLCCDCSCILPCYVIIWNRTDLQIGI